MDTRFLFWFARKAWLAFAIAFFAGTSAIGERASTSSSLFAIVCAFILLPIFVLTSAYRALYMLPVARRRVANCLWLLSTMMVPLLFITGQVSGYVIASKGGLSISTTPLILVKHAVLAFGVVASFSLVGTMERLTRAKTARSSTGVQTALVLGCLLLLAIPCAMAWLLTSSLAETTLAEAIGLVASPVFFVLSYFAAESTWLPRQAKPMRRANRPRGSATEELTSASTGKATALVRHFWSSFVVFGAIPWAFALFAQIVLRMVEESPKPDPTTTDEAQVFALTVVALLMSTMVLAFSIPNMRTMRMLPVSRVRLACLLLSMPVAMYVFTLVVVPIGVVVFGWPPTPTAILLTFLLSVHLLLLNVLLARGYKAGVAIAMLAMPIFFIASIVTDLGPTDLLVPAMLLAFLAFGSTFYLIGNSSKIYQRKSPLEEIIAMRQ